jgi:hypothetical protein
VPLPHQRSQGLGQSRVELAGQRVARVHADRRSIEADEQVDVALRLQLSAIGREN